MSDATQKFRIGRDSACDLVITDRSVSRRHADLMIESDGGLEILDRESSSGTFLLREGKEHSISRARLRPSDSIRFGDCEMSVKDLVEKLRRLPVRGAALRASASDSLPPLPVKIPPLPAQATSTAPVAAGSNGSL